MKWIITKFDHGHVSSQWEFEGTREEADAALTGLCECGAWCEETGENIRY